jgi:hypothetical protein
MSWLLAIFLALAAAATQAAAEVMQCGTDRPFPPITNNQQYTMY